VRKLVLETGKFNVLTAHSTREAIDIFHLFPNVNAAIIASGADVDCETVSETIKTATNKVTVICLSPRVGAMYRAADYTLNSHEPQELLNTVRSLFGDPRDSEGP
jgi:DNA-binding response OmpR family regulator